MSITPGPWEIIQLPSMAYRIDAKMGPLHVCPAIAHGLADARIIAAAPDLLEALLNVRKLISEAASTGFHYNDGDWAERLYFSQQKTSAAIKKATGDAS